MIDLLHDVYRALKRSSKNYPYGVARSLLAASRESAPATVVTPMVDVAPGLPVLFVLSEAALSGPSAVSDDSAQRFGPAGRFLVQAVQKGMKRDLRAFGACVTAAEYTASVAGGVRYVVAFGAEAATAIGLSHDVPLNSWSSIDTVSGARAVRSVELVSEVTDAGEKRKLWDTLKLLIAVLEEGTR